jgi:hypothetical protein
MLIQRLSAAVLAALVVTGISELARGAAVAHWTLDNNASGLQNLGTDGATSNLVAATAEASIGGGPTFSPAGGAAGGYATFDGNQALVATMAGNVADDLSGYPFTISAWIRPVGIVGTGRAAAVGIINGAAADQYMSMGVETITEGENLQAARRNVGFDGTTAPASSATIHDGNWHHVAGVYSNPTNFQLYLDGSQVAVDTTLVAFPGGINSVGIGAMRRSAGFIDKYFGGVDDVWIFNEALIGSQILFMKNNPGAAPPLIRAGDVNLDGLVNGADLQIIANNFFDTGAPRGDGDLNADGVVDFDDFRIWKTDSPALVAGGSAVVPEPASAVMAAGSLAALMFAAARFRRA